MVEDGSGGDFYLGRESFVGKLSFNDLSRLRSAVKRVHLRHLPANLYSDVEADKIIEALGPVIAESLLKQAVDGTIGRLVAD